MGRAELTAGTSETLAGESILQNKMPIYGRNGRFNSLLLEMR
jgi:hypothetical protein